MKTVTVTVTGDCPNCGQANFTQVTAQVPEGPYAAMVTGSAACGGGCGATVAMSGAG